MTRLSIGQAPAFLTVLEFSPNGALLAAGTADGHLHLYDLKAKQWLPLNIRPHKSKIHALSFSPDGSLLASGAEEGWVAITQTRSGKLLRTLPIGKSNVTAVRFAQNGAELAASAVAVSQDPDAVDDTAGEVCVWSGASYKPLRKFSTHSLVWSLGLSAHGDFVFIGCDDSQIWDLHKGTKIWSRRADFDMPADISPNGKYVAFKSTLWDVRKNRQIEREFRQPTLVRFSRDGAMIIEGSAEDGISVLDGNSGALLADLDVYEDNWTVSSDGSKIAFVDSDGELALVNVDLKAVRAVARRRAHPSPQALANDALRQAIHHNDMAALKKAIAAGADVNAPDDNFETPLSLAAFTGNVSIFETLIHADARFDPKDAKKMDRLLGNAVDQGGLPMVRFLMEHGASLPPKNNGFPLIVTACEDSFAKPRAVDLVAYLLDHGAFVDDRDRINGRTPLMAAAENGKAAIVRLLLERGADPTLVDTNSDAKDHQPAIMDALTNGDRQTIAALIDVSPNLKMYDAIERAVWADNTDIIAKLVAKGADVNKKDATYGETPMFTAVRKKRMKAISILIALGADLSIKNSDDRTVFDLGSDPEITVLLRQTPSPK